MEPLTIKIFIVLCQRSILIVLVSFVLDYLLEIFSSNLKKIQWLYCQMMVD